MGVVNYEQGYSAEGCNDGDREKAMSMRACAFAFAALAALSLQGMVAASDVQMLGEAEVREYLIWNSPWEGRANPPQLYSFRTVFRKRRDRLIAETISYATNQRSASVVTFRDGRIGWQDSNGADVDVAVGESGDLMGSATSTDKNLQIVFKPRP